MDVPKNMDISPAVRFILIAICVTIIFGVVLMAAPKPKVPQHPEITISIRYYNGHTYLVFREKYVNGGVGVSISAVHDIDCRHIKCNNERSREIEGD